MSRAMTEAGLVNHTAHLFFGLHADTGSRVKVYAELHFYRPWVTRIGRSASAKIVSDLSAQTSALDTSLIPEEQFKVLYAVQRPQREALKVGSVGASIDKIDKAAQAHLQYVG